MPLAVNHSYNHCSRKALAAGHIEGNVDTKIRNLKQKELHIYRNYRIYRRPPVPTHCWLSGHRLNAI